MGRLGERCAQPLMQTPHHHNDMLLLLPLHGMITSSWETDRLMTPAPPGDKETTHITNRHTGRKLQPRHGGTCCGTRSQTTYNTAALNPLRFMAGRSSKRNWPCRKNTLLPALTCAVHQLLQPAEHTNTPACAPKTHPSHDRTSCLPTQTHGHCTALLPLHCCSSAHNTPFPPS